MVAPPSSPRKPVGTSPGAGDWRGPAARARIRMTLWIGRSVNRLLHQRGRVPVRLSSCARRWLPLMLPLLCASCIDVYPDRPAAAIGTSAVDTAQPVPESRPPAPRRRPRPTSDTLSDRDRDRFIQVRRGLRRLVVAEQGFYAENGVYTEDLARLGFRPDSETSYRFLSLTRDGWAVSGTHLRLPGRDCVIFVGRVPEAPRTLTHRRRPREGMPVCDVARQPARGRPRPRSVPAPVEPVNPLEAVSPSVQMRVDLWNLVKSQEVYFGTQGIYSRRTEPFVLQYLWYRGVTLRILTADDESWSASAIHTATPGKSCVIWFGAVTARPATEEQKLKIDRPGVPLCDD